MKNKTFDSFRRWLRGLSESDRIHMMEFSLFLLLFLSLSLAFLAAGLLLPSLGSLGVAGGLVMAKGFGADREDLARAGALGVAILVVYIMLHIVFSGVRI